MEIQRGESNKRRLLVAFGENEAFGRLCQELKHDYWFVHCSDADEALETLNEQFNDLSAALIDEDLASENDYAFLRSVAEDRCFDTIPFLVVSRSGAAEPHDRCFEEGAVDIIGLSDSVSVTKQRIKNAISLRRSASFYEIGSMLRVLPSMIFLKDVEGRYVFSTQYWHHLETGGDPKWTIRGKTDLDVRKDKENAKAAMEADKEIIRSGKGTSYVIEINADGIQDFIELFKEPVFDEHGNVTGIIALGNNVTESELMKRKLAVYALKDELTGLGNRRGFNEFVDSIAERDDFPIAVISADCDNLKIVNDTFGHLVGDEYLHMTAVVLRSAAPDEELIFRIGGDEFAVFAPHTTAEEAKKIVDQMERNAELFTLSQGKVVISYGVASINGPDDDAWGKINLADKLMYEEKARHKQAGL